MGCQARNRPLLLFAGVVALLVGSACSRDEQSPRPFGRPYPAEPFPTSDEILERRPAQIEGAQENPPASQRSPANPNRNAYFGDLHVHTTWSMDAFSFGTTATPRDAYRYARGAAIAHPSGFQMQLRQPLDFYAVTDHALFLGLAAEAADTTTEFSKLEVSQPLHDLNDESNRGTLSVLSRLGLFADFIPGVLTGILDGTIDREATVRVKKTAWLDIIEAADEFNDPGEFTTFVAYEYTPNTPDGSSLHRNVIFRGSDRLPAEPFDRYNSRSPEGLWVWMDGLRAQGIESLAIPHNSNGSNGQMFALSDWAGNPLDDEYATRRIRNEPLVEITQVKGTSETHPALSDTDEWADFEIKPFIGSSTRMSEPRGSYVRQALREGMALEESGITNPFKVGFVAASDAHTGATTDDEANFYSKIGILDATPELRGSVPLPWWQAMPMKWLAPKLVQDIGGRSYSSSPLHTFGASGLAGVWAEENTREAIYEAFRRKETFATSGPRIPIRFFGGYQLDPALLESPEAIRGAYAQGVAMGGELVGQDTAVPIFFAHATRDAQSAPLQRLQIIKGWVDGGETYERIYDVACSDQGTPDPKTHRCPDNNARVDPSDCSYSQDVGAGELQALWQDPDFDPDQRAFYYTRVLENPTCRWSTWDALRKGVAPRPDLAQTLQERAWSSPIWYQPAGREADPAPLARPAPAA